ncbi:transglycosylase domain-containing protein [Armatimonas sp.]|uniref:transglycosylase domain-containing protein n=1 Tax=Armatimonas sp. TaxID=1872638 RepID=UPI003751F36D
MGRPRRRRKGGFRLWISRFGAFLGILSALILTALISGLLWAGGRVQLATVGMPNATALNQETAGGITQVYSTDKVLLGEIYSRFQEREDLVNIPQTLRDATVSIEDQRFYSHPGIDLRGIVRALYKNASGARRGEGASTLTQQLVRNVILRNREKTERRKLQEALLAYQVERSMTKDQILERYLNEVNYGGQIYGVKMAAKLYFGKDIKKITLSEAALVAGLVQIPKDTYPFRRLNAALERRNTVLGKMLELKKITQEQYDQARAEKIKIQPNEPRVVSEEYKAPHFVRYVLRQLIARHGPEVVLQGGLKIYTTLNWEMQQRADEILRAGIRGERGRQVTEGALICLEPHTGWIRAMAGGVDEKSLYNFATQGGRQPGSSFKPVVYAAAFNTGKYSPNTEMIDRPLKLGRKTWPRNYGGKGGHGGSYSIEDALAQSLNTIPAQLIQRVGWSAVVDLAKKMGVKSKMPSNDLSICLGTSLVTPLEMASVFSTFANGGDHASPIAIRLVLDGKKNVLERNEPRITKAVLRESTAANIGLCLEAVVKRGTAKAANVVEGARGKTGTTTDNRDTWFVGYTKELVTAIWACNREVKPKLDKQGKAVLDKKTGKPKMNERYLVMDSDATGGHVCAPIWGRYMQAAVPIQQRAGLEPIALPEDRQKQLAEAAKALPTPRPDRTNDDGEMVVVMCEESSKRATAFCPDVVEKTFSQGTKIATCGLHKTPDAALKPGEPVEPTPSPAPRRRRRRDLAREEEQRSELERLRREREAELGTTDETKAPREAAASEVEVLICSESSKRATDYCPEKVTRRFPAGINIRACTLHRARPGEEGR